MEILIPAGQFFHILEDVEKHLGRLLECVNISDLFGSVVIQNGLGFLFVGADAPLDHFIRGVIKTVFLQGAFAKAPCQFRPVRAAKMKYLEQFNMVAQQFRLGHASRNTIQQEKINVRLVNVNINLVADLGAPEI